MKRLSYVRFAVRVLGFHPGITLVNLGCNVVIFSRNAAFAFLIREIFNALERGQAGGLTDVWPLLAGCLAAALASATAIMCCAVLDNLRGYFYQNRLRVNFMRLLSEQPDLTQVTGNASRLFEVADDDVPGCVFPMELLTEVAGFCVYTLVAVGMLLWIDWQMTLFLFLPLSLAIYIVRRVSEQLREKHAQNREAHAGMTSGIGDMVNSVLSIKAAGAEGAMLSHFDELSRARMKAVLRDVLFGAQAGAAINGVVQVGTVLVMLLAARGMRTGGFPLGDFSMFVMYLGTLANCIERVMELVGEVQKAKACYARITQAVSGAPEADLMLDRGPLLRKPEGIAPAPRHRVPLRAFRVERLSVRRPGGQGLEQVSFALEAGELVAVCGTVGSGKSTLLSALMGVLPVSEGQVLWNGRPVTGARNFLVPPNAGYAPQRPRLFSESIEENVRLGRPLSPGQLQEAFELAALGRDLTELSQGAHTSAGRQGEGLSGGQRQRVALARMLAGGASLNLLDDATSALDAGTEQAFWTGFVSWLKREGRAAIVATNKPLPLRLADRIVVLRAGRVAAVGAFDQLTSESAAFRAVMNAPEAADALGETR